VSGRVRRVVSIKMAFGRENTEQMPFMCLSSLEDVEPFFAGFEIPNIRLHMEKSCMVP
jgi:hypothetical protein